MGGVSYQCLQLADSAEFGPVKTELANETRCIDDLVKWMDAGGRLDSNGLYRCLDR